MEKSLATTTSGLALNISVKDIGTAVRIHFSIPNDHKSVDQDTT